MAMIKYLHLYIILTLSILLFVNVQLGACSLEQNSLNQLSSGKNMEGCKMPTLIPVIIK